jgi:type II secretory pathway pseudopilin PulG
MTIVELLVAMTIFAGVALSLAYTLQMALLSTRDNRSRVQAAHLAARELEIVRNNFGVTRTARPCSRRSRSWSTPTRSRVGRRASR